MDIVEPHYLNKREDVHRGASNHDASEVSSCWSFLSSLLKLDYGGTMGITVLNGEFSAASPPALIE